jgi:hypothetical protein
MSLALLLDNWMLLIGLFTVGLLAYWLLDERGDADGAGDLIERVGERAESVTAGFLDATGSLVVVIASIGITIGAQLMETFGALNEVLGHAPFVIGHGLFALLTFAGLEGYIPLNVVQLGMAFIVITIVALVVRYGPDGSRSSEA